MTTEELLLCIAQQKKHDLEVSNMVDYRLLTHAEYMLIKEFGNDPDKLRKMLLLRVNREIESLNTQNND